MCRNCLSLTTEDCHWQLVFASQVCSTSSPHCTIQYRTQNIVLIKMSAASMEKYKCLKTGLTEHWEPRVDLVPGPLQTHTRLSTDCIPGTPQGTQNIRVNETESVLHETYTFYKGALNKSCFRPCRWKKQYVKKLHSPYHQICKRKLSYRDGAPVVANIPCNRKTFQPLVNQPNPFDFDHLGLIVCLSSTDPTFPQTHYFTFYLNHRKFISCGVEAILPWVFRHLKDCSSVERSL